MNNRGIRINRIWKIVAIICWVASLYGTETTYYTYVLLAILGVLIVFHNSKNHRKNNKKVVCIILGIIFSLLITAGHYYLLFQYGTVVNILRIVALIVGGVVLFYEFFSYGYLTLAKSWLKKADVDKDKIIKVFIISAAIIFIIRLLYLIFCRYPGPIQYDTMIQLDEIYKHRYTNHHPIVMTWMIELGIKISTALGGTITTGIFLYALLQIFCISLVIGYLMMTLYEMGIKKWIRIIVYIYFIIHPLNILFIDYVQKDASFAFSMLLMIVSLYRVIYRIGSKRWLNYTLLVLGSIGTVLLRSNGILALLFVLIAVLIMKIGSDKKYISIAIGSVMVASIIFKGPIFNLLNVASTEFCEGLSIPIQQVGRVVYNQNELTSEEEQQIKQLIDIDSVRYNNPYDPHCSDNIKGIIQYGQRDKYFEEHKWEYLKLWLELGLKYPRDYFEAYVDETSGYWIPGIGTGILKYLGETERAPVFYVDQIVICEPVFDAVNYYQSLFEDGGILHLLSECGLFIYLLFYMFIIAIWKRNHTAVLATPGLATVVSLWIATPLYGDQRYIYAIFVILPFVILAVFRKDKEIICDESDK